MNKVDSWRRMPVDDVGYFKAEILDEMSDEEIRVWAGEFEERRYKGWRNRGNKWRMGMGLDDTSGKTVLDYGCGFGIEALQFAKAGNDVVVSDLCADNIKAAQRVLGAFGHSVRGMPCSIEPPFFMAGDYVDVFYSNGVLHHTPHIREILLRACEILNPGGEIRLMLYTDRAWRKKTGEKLPPIDADVSEACGFRRFVRAMDGSAGWYADWYNVEKLEHRFGDFLEIVDHQYIAKHDWYSTVRMVPKG